MIRHLCFGLSAENFDVLRTDARPVSAVLSAMRHKTDIIAATGDGSDGGDAGYGSDLVPGVNSISRNAFCAIMCSSRAGTIQI